MAWEKTALDLAAQAGIAVPENHLHTIAGSSVLIVDRFDRTADGPRVGYMSAMAALEAVDGDTRSYLDIAEAIEERSRTAGAELRQLWRRVAFLIPISNTDDHLRNHAFLHVDTDARSLSPAFDLNPNPEPGPKHLSTAIGDDTRADLRDLLSVAELFRLNSDEALTVLGEVHRAVRQWKAAATRHGLTVSDLTAMSDAFEHAQTAVADNLLSR